MDTLDIIRQLQADPALKAELRAVLLGEEVLGLPELVKDNSRQIAALTVRMERVDEQIAENSRQIAALTEAVRAHDARLESVEVSINALIDHQAEMQSSIRSDIQDLARMSAHGVAAMQQGFLEMSEGFVVVNERIHGLDTKFTAKFDQVESEIRDVKSDISPTLGGHVAWGPVNSRGLVNYAALAIMTPLRRPRYVDENGGGRPVTSAFLGACEPVL